jgi:NitT/TauT family transport system permease protein
MSIVQMEKPLAAQTSAPAAGPVVIDARNLSLTYGGADSPVVALSDINLQIGAGEFVSLIGPSGCGKTTLMRVVADLVQPTGGVITVNGMSPAEARRARAYGYVFQAPALYPWRTVRRNLTLPLEIMGIAKGERAERAKRYLAMVGLDGFEGKFPWQLSGGMQQRVSIARALCFDPQLLLMDEPFGALDEITRDHLNEQLLRLWERAKKTVIFVTHSIPEAVFLSSRIVSRLRIGCASPCAPATAMTIDVTAAAVGRSPTRPLVWRRLVDGKVLPVATVLILLVIVWYIGSVLLNRQAVLDRLDDDDPRPDMMALIGSTFAMERPILPAPHQVASEFIDSVFLRPVTSKRSLVYHAWVTGSAAVVGFAMGSLLGILLAIGIVHLPTLDRSLLPWIIASQTVPILAIAPMIIVVLGNLGLTGLMPKAVISMYLCFFPVTIGMVKGLRSPDPLQLDLMRTYSASEGQVFRKLRWPSSAVFLFTSLKVAVAISLVGAIVGELPTGAQAGIGARLLSGSYYGQTVQIWAALFMAAFLGMILVALVELAERVTLRRMGAG